VNLKKIHASKEGTMLDVMDMTRLFEEIERDLASLERLTARSLQELDSHASADLSRWIENWALLDELGKD
jgi:hypothetical protein